MPKQPLTLAKLHAFALSLPAVTMDVQWGDDHVFKVGAKMFLVTRPKTSKDTGLSFKASEEAFVILTQEAGISPAPYLARAKWVKLDSIDRLPAEDLKAYISRAHGLVAATLTKKLQRELGLLI